MTFERLSLHIDRTTGGKLVSGCKWIDQAASTNPLYGNISSTMDLGRRGGGNSRYFSRGSIHRSIAGLRNCP